MNYYIKPLLAGFLLLSFSAQSNAQSDIQNKKKEINTVDVTAGDNKTVKEIIISYTDGTSETLTEQEATKRGLINNGGYGNAQRGTSKNVPPVSGISLRKDSSHQHGQPIFVVEGKEISKEEMNSINPSNIESINVLKNESAIHKYGVKGRNGVVEIKLKNSTNLGCSIKEFDSLEIKKMYAFIGAKETDEIISFRIVVESNEEDIITSQHTGSIWSVNDTRTIQLRRKGTPVAFDNIIVNRNGKQIKLPAKTVQL